MFINNTKYSGRWLLNNCTPTLNVFNNTFSNIQESSYVTDLLWEIFTKQMLFNSLFIAVVNIGIFCEVGGGGGDQ